MSLSTDMTPGPKRPRWARRPRPINPQALARGEWMTEIGVMVSTGDFVEYDNCLVSPRYPHCYIASQIAASLGFPIRDLNPSERRRYGPYGAPCGLIDSTRAVSLTVTVDRLPVPQAFPPPPWHLNVIVLDDNVSAYLGVAVVLGRSFLDHLYGPGGWPPQQLQQLHNVSPVLPAQGAGHGRCLGDPALPSAPLR
ncbi:hypothetical protein VTK26DRAFT_5982 [Humicola hyalothermophila]